jgi:xanthine dehydrogenase accessory factor
MSNHFQDILHQWYLQKDQFEWVLATVVQTKGSSYRKVGARMMINNFGQSFGMLSGGCLEADLKRQAQKCWLTSKNNIVCYDMSDESDITWQLGIGCGGMVKVMLQPISANNNYLQLNKLLQLLEQNNHVHYHQIVNDGQPANSFSQHPKEASINASFDRNTLCFSSFITPKPNVVIFGGGVDTLPLVSLAKTMAWHITLIDSRTNYARPSVFKTVDTIINKSYQSLTDHPNIINADAIVIMHHNIEFDAQAINIAQHSQCDYIGLLGPQHRTERVLNHKVLKDKPLTKPLINPIGLDLGGDLPESIALSIISQIQSYLESASALSKNEMQLTKLLAIDRTELIHHAT